MLKTANKHGYTSEDTIRCSQELDQLIYEYQLNVQNDVKLGEECKFPLKKMMLVLPKRISETKYKVLM